MLDLVASLRAVHGRAGDDPEARALVDLLLRESEEFAALWSSTRSPPSTGRSSASPTRSSGLRLDGQILASEKNLTERLVVFTAAPGSEDAERLALLSVVGSQEFPAEAPLPAS